MYTSDNAELRDWGGEDTPTSSLPSSLMQGRRPLSGALTPTISTEYESASSELHFSTTASSHGLSEDGSDFGSLFLVELRSRETQRNRPDPSASISYMSSKVFRFPFESILRFLFDLDPTTLDLLKEQPRPHPDGSSTPSELFPAHLSNESSQLNGDSDEGGTARPRAGLARFSDEAHEAIRTIRKGLDALAEHNTPVMHGPFMGAGSFIRLQNPLVSCL
ncbi:hypothetical protein BS47DRAFT_1213654 [Hydnum rufescens UP504]|uniref:Uncharacterized protein n=1 Tax=Hydnum rufescens UP504 TaxID=1448309 RepID=A0A9P6AS72_9AGAM|nr:hypothetical protein BS47DRAFT_1213654 [Hydnum rufescens UP504]